MRSARDDVPYGTGVSARVRVRADSSVGHARVAIDGVPTLTLQPDGLPWESSWGGSRWTRARTVSLLLLIVILLLGSLVVVVDVLRGEMGGGDM